MNRSEMKQNRPTISIQDLEIIFPDKFPKSYVNDVLGWGVSREHLHSRASDGNYKLITLDIDYGEKCSLACPHCFRKSISLETENPPLAHDELLSIVEEALPLGLQSIKVLGAGEPFEDCSFLSFLRELSKMGIDTAVFTKGHVLGSDELAKATFANDGINSAVGLVKLLKSLRVSILLGFNSFSMETQNAYVGATLYSDTSDYFEFRNAALINLVKAGFNEFIPGQPSRLALIAAPIKPENIGEIFDIYVWGRRRNMYVLSCPTTYSGLGINELNRERSLTTFESYISKLVDLYADIYMWNLRYGITDLDTLSNDGVSLYPGAHPCNQVAAGMYVTLRGKVTVCPGRDDSESIIAEDIRRSSLKDVWLNSVNYKRAESSNTFNFHCVARDGYFFRDSAQFYDNVHAEVLSRINREHHDA